VKPVESGRLDFQYWTAILVAMAFVMA